MASLNLPQPPAGGLGTYLARLNQTLIRAFLDVVTVSEPARQIMLVSPNGTKYAVTVSDAGTLITTAV